MGGGILARLAVSRCGSLEATGDQFEPYRLVPQREGPVNGRHHVIIDTYHWPALQSYFQELVSRCQGQDWHEIASNLGRYGHWEFEGYAQAEGKTEPGPRT